MSHRKTEGSFLKMWCIIKKNTGFGNRSYLIILENELQLLYIPDRIHEKPSDSCDSLSLFATRKVFMNIYSICCGFVSLFWE